jgi:hypothetical protein
MIPNQQGDAPMIRKAWTFTAALGLGLAVIAGCGEEPKETTDHLTGEAPANTKPRPQAEAGGEGPGGEFTAVPSTSIPPSEVPPNYPKPKGETRIPEPGSGIEPTPPAGESTAPAPAPGDTTPPAEPGKGDEAEKS